MIIGCEVDPDNMKVGEWQNIRLVYIRERISSKIYIDGKEAVTKSLLPHTWGTKPSTVTDV